MLLVLLIAGRTDRGIINRHRRLESYSVHDFDLLVDMISEWGGAVWVTPNTLTEASNLLGQHRSPERELLFETLAKLISESQELLIESIRASRHPRFIQLGLADAALLEVISSDRPLLTADSRLYAAALVSNADSATNFNHHRAGELVT
jgi:predicted nucleic acid-binding protein